MSTDRDTTRIVRSWLRTDEHESADRVLDAVLDQLDTTPQRPSSWLARRFLFMNNTVRIAVAAAAIIIVAVLGVRFLGPAESVGGPPDSPAPAPTATPQLLGDGALEPGTVVATGFGANESTTFTFTVPEGWEGFGGVCVLPTTGTEAPDGMGFCLGEVNAGLYSDPCHGSTGQPDIPIGPTVDELANAIAAQPAYEATNPTDVTLAGYSGKRLDLQLPPDVESCDNGEFYPWGGSIYAQGPDNRWHIWILDVEGDRVVILSTDYAGTSAEDLAEQQAIVDSIRIDP